MSNIVKKAMGLHKEAMKFSEKAQIARIRGERADAFASFREAFRLEKEAAMLLKDERVKLVTRAVLFRSAAVLALDCNDISEVEELVNLGLSGEVPPQIADELHDLGEIVTKRRARLHTAREMYSGVEKHLRTINLNSQISIKYKKPAENGQVFNVLLFESMISQNLEIPKTNHPPKTTRPPTKMITDFNSQISITLRYMQIFQSLLNTRNWRKMDRFLMFWPFKSTISLTKDRFLKETDEFLANHGIWPVLDTIPQNSWPDSLFLFGFGTNLPQTSTIYEEQLTH